MDAWENMDKRSAADECKMPLKSEVRTIESLATTQEQAVLLSLRINDNFTESSSSDEEDYAIDEGDTSVLKISDVDVNSVLIESKYEFVAQMCLDREEENVISCIFRKLCHFFLVIKIC